VFPVRYEHHPYIKNKAIPVIGRGGLQDFEMSRIPYYPNNRFIVAVSCQLYIYIYIHIYIYMFRPSSDVT
jgi:hypothetical protein